MYRVYTRETPAMPYRGVITASAALALTVGAAWQLVATQHAPVELGETVHLKYWPISFDLPRGWSVSREHVAATASPTGDRLVYKGTSADGAARTLVVRFSVPGWQATASFAAQKGMNEAHAIQDALSGYIDVRQVTRIRDGPPIGGVASTLIEMHVPAYDGESMFALSAGAALPSGHEVTLVLTGLSAATTADLRLFRSIADSCRWVDPELSRDGATTGPLTCDVPDGAWRVAMPPGAAGGQEIGFVSAGDSAHPWTMTIRPTILVNGRTCLDLAHDASAMFQVTPWPEVAAPDRVGERRALRAFTFAGRTIVVGAIDLGQGRAAFLRAVADDDTAGSLAAQCNRVADSIAVGSTPWPFDPVEAAERGADLMKRVYNRGIAPLFPEAARWQALVVRDGERVYRRSAERVTPPDRPDGHWTGLSRNAEGDADQPSRLYHMVWQMNTDGGAFESQEEISDRIAMTREVTTHLRRAAVDAPLSYHVKVGRRVVEATIPTAANYLPDPLVDAIVAHAALHPEGGDVLFRNVSFSTRGLAALFVRPLAPDERFPEWRRAVEWSDYWPEPVVYYVSIEGALERIDFGRNYVSEPCDGSELTGKWFDVFVDGHDGD
jgi:hypothetical protein